MNISRVVNEKSGTGHRLVLQAWFPQVYFSHGTGSVHVQGLFSLMKTESWSPPVNRYKEDSMVAAVVCTAQ